MVESRPTLDQTIADTLTAVERAIRLAFAMGRDGAVSRINVALLEMGGQLTVTETPPAREAIPSVRNVGRAVQGTVKPAILALTERPNGATIEEMASSGIKSNSIRGTVYALHKEGKIGKRGDRWFRVSQQRNEAPAEKSEGAS